MDLLDLGKNPIHPERPAGEDVRYHPLFDQLQAEVDKISLPSVAGSVDWDNVVSLSSEILSTKSKDLLVAGYLTVGLIHTRKFEGLAAGLRICRDLIVHHGPDLYPLRQRGRLLSIEWLKERSEAALNQLEHPSIVPAELARMQEDVRKLQDALNELLPEAPSLQVLSDFIDAVVAPIGPISPIGPIGPMSPPPQPATQREALDELVRRMRQSATLLRELDSTNPVAYRLSRQAAWLEIIELPPVHLGKTLLPPPPERVVKGLATRLEQGDKANLIKDAESLLHDFIFWLDLNRFAASALANLGAYAAAATVGQETSFLLQRVPGLDQLCFADGTPFANAATKEWLQKLPHARPETGAENVTSPDVAKAGEATITDEMEAATALLREGRIEEAVERIQGGVRKSLSEREKLQWRLALSRALVETDNPSFALPHLEQVVTDVDRFGLDAYDPTLALEGLRLAWHAYESQQDQLSKEKAKQALHRIGRIDLAEMIRLTR